MDQGDGLTHGPRHGLFVGRVDQGPPLGHGRGHSQPARKLGGPDASAGVGVRPSEPAMLGKEIDPPLGLRTLDEAIAQQLSNEDLEPGEVTGLRDTLEGPHDRSRPVDLVNHVVSVNADQEDAVAQSTVIPRLEGESEVGIVRERVPIEREEGQPRVTTVQDRYQVA